MTKESIKFTTEGIASQEMLKFQQEQLANGFFGIKFAWFDKWTKRVIPLTNQLPSSTYEQILNQKSF